MSKTFTSTFSVAAFLWIQSVFTFAQKEGEEHDYVLEVEEARASLAEVRVVIEGEKLPLGEELHNLELELLTLRRQAKLARLEKAAREEEIKSLDKEAFQVDRYLADLESTIESYQISYQAFLLPGEVVGETEGLESILKAGVQRLEKLGGGGFIDGRATVVDGVVLDGTYAVLGPLTWFRSEGQVAAVEVSYGSQSAELLEGEVSSLLFEGRPTLVEVDVTGGKSSCSCCDPKRSI